MSRYTWSLGTTSNQVGITRRTAVGIKPFFILSTKNQVFCLHVLAGYYIHIHSIHWICPTLTEINWYIYIYIVARRSHYKKVPPILILGIQGSIYCLLKWAFIYCSFQNLGSQGDSTQEKLWARGAVRCPHRIAVGILEVWEAEAVSRRLEEWYVCGMNRAVCSKP